MPGDDSVWKKLYAKVMQLAKPDPPHVNVGILASGRANAQHGKDQFSIIELAAVHEFGSPATKTRGAIPERSFIRRTFVIKKDELVKIQTKLAKALLDDSMTLERALGLLGTWGAAEIKKTVSEGEGIPPPLQPETIRRKGSSRPLVDTHLMINSITWEVKL